MLLPSSKNIKPDLKKNGKKKMINKQVDYSHCWWPSIQQRGCPLSGHGLPSEEQVKSSKSWENKLSKKMHLRMVRDGQRRTGSLFWRILLHPVFFPQPWTRFLKERLYQHTQYSWVISMIKSVGQFWRCDSSSRHDVPLCRLVNSIHEDGNSWENESRR